MTRDEARLFRYGGLVPPSVLPSVSCSVVSVSPLSDTEVVQPVAPKVPSPDDFNRIPLDAVKIFQGVRRMDPLHRSDRLGELANRGTRLGEYISEKGAESFVSHYKKS